MVLKIGWMFVWWCSRCILFLLVSFGCNVVSCWLDMLCCLVLCSRGGVSVGVSISLVCNLMIWVI